MRKKVSFEAVIHCDLSRTKLSSLHDVRIRTFLLPMFRLALTHEKLVQLILTAKI